MPYLDNKKFNEIREAAKKGNEKAAMVLQIYKNAGTQEDLDRLVSDYYAIPKTNEIVSELEEPDSMEEKEEPKEEIINQSEVDTNLDSIPEVEDLTEVLDKETEGLFDENEIEGIDFIKFLGNKHRDGLRIKKNADYFKVFNPEGRANYAAKKKELYKSKFKDSLHDIDCNFKDNDLSIDKYSQGVNDLLDDNVEIDVGVTSNAYDEITGNNGIMHSFGRHWDEEDTNRIIEDLKGLVTKYGKKNVLAALTTLKSDNINFRDYKLGQINEEIERYNKGLDKILK